MSDGAQTALPAVTVLLPVYNAGEHLRAAVLSILGQSHDDIELLAINDGSTDGSGDVLDSIDDDRMRVIHQENHGLAETLNIGLRHASHEFVARMDQDDLSLPGRLEAQVRVLSSRPEVGAVACCYELMDESGVRTGSVHLPADDDYLARQLYFRNVLPHGAMMLRRSAVLDVGGYRSIGPAEDYDLWTRLSLKWRMTSLPEVLFRYRVTASGMSQTGTRRQRELLRSVRAGQHIDRPLVLPPARQIARAGRELVRRQPHCDGLAASYAFDHAGIALQLLRQRRWGAAARASAGVALFIATMPSAAAGLAMFRPLRSPRPAGNSR